MTTVFMTGVFICYCQTSPARWLSGYNW